MLSLVQDELFYPNGDLDKARDEYVSSVCVCVCMDFVCTTVQITRC